MTFLAMNRDDRKAAVAAYKERKAQAGVYVVRCVATGEQWVVAAPDLATIWTRRSFALRQGSDTNPALQAAWNAHGAGGFTLAVLEELDADALGFARERTFKERLQHWREELGAGAM